MSLTPVRRRATPGRRHAASPEGGRGRALLVLLLVFILLGIGAGGFYLWATGAGGGPSQPVAVVIPKGATAAAVGTLLQERHVIRSALVFRVMAGFRGLGSSIQAGRYRLRTNMSISEALTALAAGPIVESVTVTVPEGLRVTEIGKRVADALKIRPNTFVKRAESGDFELPPYLAPGRDTVEGFLFPKTYEFTKGADADRVIERMLEQFDTEVAGLPWKNAKRLGISPYEAVIVASLVEEEARVKADRPKIASVIYNRLEVGLNLGIDATVQYIDPDPSNGITDSDLAIDSPYNTRLAKNLGLPPTPIASPGLPSLKAALQPADTDYLYFLVVDPDSGRHEFAETEEEFFRLKAQAQGG